MPSPLPVAPVNETDVVLLPDGLKALKRVAKTVGLDLRGASRNLDAGFDSTHNRKRIVNTGMIPNMKANPRHRKRPKRGRKRLFTAAIHALRTRVDRTFAWEDKFKRLLLLRFEPLQHRHFGMKLLAYPLINVREFCGAKNSQSVHYKHILWGLSPWCRLRPFRSVGRAYPPHRTSRSCEVKPRPWRPRPDASTQETGRPRGKRTSLWTSQRRHN
jgi:hypothetical protein